jgi:hypothetical protein
MSAPVTPDGLAETTRADERSHAVTTICKVFADEAEARPAVEALLAEGIDGMDVRLLKGAPRRDAREEVHGGFASGHGDDPMGSFAGPGHAPGGEGAFAPERSAAARRVGSFGDVDRESVATFPSGVEDVSVTGHGQLVALLKEAGLDASAAARDVEALHEGRVLVLVMVEDAGAADVERVLAAAAA